MSDKIEGQPEQQSESEQQQYKKKANKISSQTEKSIVGTNSEQMRYKNADTIYE